MAALFEPLLGPGGNVEPLFHIRRSHDYDVGLVLLVSARLPWSKRDVELSVVLPTVGHVFAGCSIGRKILHVHPSQFFTFFFRVQFCSESHLVSLSVMLLRVDSNVAVVWPSGG